MKLNEKDECGDYPLLWAINKNNIEMVQLLMKYANQHQIILKLNEKKINGNYPILNAISNKNIEIVQLLIEYALQYQIILEYDEKHYYINNSKPKIKNLLEDYEIKMVWK